MTMTIYFGAKMKLAKKLHPQISTEYRKKINCRQTFVMCTHFSLKIFTLGKKPHIFGRHAAISAMKTL